MPSFVLSFALLLLVLLTLLAVSNRELIALTFLGVSTVALPLSIWILGAIAVGFLLGFWILLLFRLGTVGAGSGSPWRDKRRANYGPEDFAVVDERLTEGQPAPVYRDGRYDNNRYDDIYGQDQYGSPYGEVSGASARGSEGYVEEQGYDAADYDAQRYNQRYNQGYDAQGSNLDRADGYAQGSHKDASNEPQDNFSAATGYSSTGRSRESMGGATEPEDLSVAPAPRAESEVNPSDSTPDSIAANRAQATSPNASAPDPAMPADWDDQYREDWTQDELSAQPEPILRDQSAGPKLKRWLSTEGEARPRLNLGGFSLGGAAKPRQGTAGQDADGTVYDGTVSEADAPGATASETTASETTVSETYPRDAYYTEPSAPTATEAGYPGDNRGEASDWQAADERAADEYGERPSAYRNSYDSAPYHGSSEVRSRDVYDADYRVIRQPGDTGAGESTPVTDDRVNDRGSVSQPARETEPQPEKRSSSKDGRRSSSKDDWDIDADLGW